MGETQTKRILDEEEYQELKDKSDGFDFIQSLCLEYAELFPIHILSEVAVGITSKSLALIDKIMGEFGIELKKS